MNAIENLQHWLDENQHFSGGVPRQLAEDAISAYHELEQKYDEAVDLNGKAVCAYCGETIEHKSDVMKINQHMLSCSKRPEVILMKKILLLEKSLIDIANGDYDNAREIHAAEKCAVSKLIELERMRAHG